MAKPKHPVLTVKALTKWLAAQNGRGRYEYNSPCDCLIAHFVKAQGFENVSADAAYIYIGYDRYELPRTLNAIAVDGSETYAAALKRAQAAGATP